MKLLKITHKKHFKSPSISSSVLHFYRQEKRENPQKITLFHNTHPTLILP